MVWEGGEERDRWMDLEESDNDEKSSLSASLIKTEVLRRDVTKNVSIMI